jgi:hypothetical protein
VSRTQSASFVIDPVAPRRISMSMLRAAEACLRRAHLDRAAGVPSDGDALIGSLWHECAATVGFVAVMRGVDRIDIDEAIAISRRTLARPSDPGPLPRDAHATVLDLIERWSRRARFRPGEVFEVLSEQPLNGRPLSARLDRYWRDGPVVEITDYKTGFGDVGTKLTMQGEVYAWHVFEREPDIDLVVYAEDHVRFGVPNGPYEITRDDVYGPGGIEEFLLDSLARLNTAYEAGGELPASPGSACSSPSSCPHAASCSVPEEYRPDTLVGTSEDAGELLGVMLVLEARRDALAKQARGYLTRSGARAVQLNGEEYGFAPRPGSRLDKKALAADLQAGVPVDDLDAYAVATNPTCGRRKAL